MIFKNTMNKSRPLYRSERPSFSGAEYNYRYPRERRSRSYSVSWSGRGCWQDSGSRSRSIVLVSSMSRSGSWVPLGQIRADVSW